jgi:hypothetical protein
MLDFKNSNSEPESEKKAVILTFREQSAIHKPAKNAFSQVDFLLNIDDCWNEARACIGEPSPCGSRGMDHGEFVNVLYKHDAKHVLKNLTRIDKQGNPVTLKKNDVWPIAVRVMRSAGFRISKGTLLG